VVGTNPGLVRQIVDGKRWGMETFGVEPVTAQHTDLPGHTIQMPQILAKSGIHHLATSRDCG